MCSRTMPARRSRSDAMRRPYASRNVYCRPMGERDRHAHGSFSWTDLSTPDAEASKAFYGGLFGWEFEDNPIPEGGVYVMARLGGHAPPPAVWDRGGPP